MLDPFDRILANAEFEDEPVSEAERRDIETSRFSTEGVTNYKDPL